MQKLFGRPITATPVPTKPVPSRAEVWMRAEERRQMDEAQERLDRLRDQLVVMDRRVKDQH